MVTSRSIWSEDKEKVCPRLRLYLLWNRSSKATKSWQGITPSIAISNLQTYSSIVDISKSAILDSAKSSKTQLSPTRPVWAVPSTWPHKFLTKKITQLNVISGHWVSSSMSYCMARYLGLRKVRESYWLRLRPKASLARKLHKLHKKWLGKC